MNQQGAGCDVLVIDNASTDGTAQAVQELACESIRYYDTGSNLGGAGGFAYGMQTAVTLGYTHLWLMDDDTFPQPEALAELMQADKLLSGEYGYLSSVALWTDGRECHMNRQKIKKSFYEHVELLKDGIIQIEQATFVSFLVRTAVVVSVGLPIGEFFIWGDDIEYSRRIAVRNAMPSYLVGRSTVTHATQNNVGSSIALDDTARIGRYRYAFRNENYTYRQEGFRGICYYIAKCGLQLIRIARFADDKKMKRFRIVISGMLSGFFFRPEVRFPKVESRSKNPP
jgi:GT2 family glycosyltransferase